MMSHGINVTMYIECQILVRLYNDIKARMKYVLSRVIVYVQYQDNDNNMNDN